MKPVLVSALVLLVLCAAGCAGDEADGGEIPSAVPGEVDWETAVDILHTGQVAMVTQLHNLEVTLTLKNGAEVRTIEPEIDAIFEEVEKCGRPCSDIVLVTE